MSRPKRLQRLDLPKISIKNDGPNISHRKHNGLGSLCSAVLKDGSTVNIEYKQLKDISILGSGEFGVVKKMVHEPTNLKFAVKAVSEHFIDSDNRNSSLMDIEVSIKLGDGCDNLVKFYGALFADAHYWIITEIMDTSLEKFYSKAFSLKINLPESFYALTAESVMNALGYMRKLKIMHRDIKPSNILLNSQGQIKVCDFGISGFTNSDSLCKTFKGCQRYMSPEKISPNERGYSIKADIWSLGISLIEIATGLHPYNKIYGVYELSAMILEKEAPKLDESKFSPSFCSFVDSCLIKEMDRRPSLSNLISHQFVLNNKNKETHMVLTIIRFLCDEIKKEN